MASTYLMTWNPTISPIADYDQIVRDANSAKGCKLSWSCGNTKRIEPGDRLFFFRQGLHPKGIIGDGYALSHPYPDQAWNADSKSETHYVDVRWDYLIHADLHPERVLTH